MKYWMFVVRWVLSFYKPQYFIVEVNDGSWLFFKFKGKTQLVTKFEKYEVSNAIQKKV